MEDVGRHPGQQRRHHHEQEQEYRHEDYHRGPFSSEKFAE
jgi:hypothetical protein